MTCEHVSCELPPSCPPSSAATVAIFLVHITILFPHALSCLCSHVQRLRGRTTAQPVPTLALCPQLGPLENWVAFHFCPWHLTCALPWTSTPRGALGKAVPRWTTFHVEPASSDGADLAVPCQGLPTTPARRGGLLESLPVRTLWQRRGWLQMVPSGQ